LTGRPNVVLSLTEQEATTRVGRPFLHPFDHHNLYHHDPIVDLLIGRDGAIITFDDVGGGAALRNRKKEIM